MDPTCDAFVSCNLTVDVFHEIRLERLLIPRGFDVGGDVRDGDLGSSLFIVYSAHSRILHLWVGYQHCLQFSRRDLLPVRLGC